MKLKDISVQVVSVAQMRGDVIRERMVSGSDYPQRIEALIQSREPVRLKLRKFRQLVHEMTALVGDDSACSRGCSHCCHIAVDVSKPEAELIARDIGRKAREPKRWNAGSNGFPLGYERPCTFLRDNECSIYEHRPIVCRTYFNLEKTPENCFLDAVHPVASLNMRMFDLAYMLISDSTKVADIRDFFPPGERPANKGQ